MKKSTYFNLENQHFFCQVTALRRRGRVQGKRFSSSRQNANKKARRVASLPGAVSVRTRSERAAVPRGQDEQHDAEDVELGVVSQVPAPQHALRTNNHEAFKRLFLLLFPSFFFVESRGASSSPASPEGGRKCEGSAEPGGATATGSRRPRGSVARARLPGRALQPAHAQWRLGAARARRATQELIWGSRRRGVAAGAGGDSTRPRPA